MLASVYSICHSVSITRDVYINSLGVQSVVGGMNVRVNSPPVQLPANNSSIGPQELCRPLRQPGKCYGNRCQLRTRRRSSGRKRREQLSMTVPPGSTSARNSPLAVSLKFVCSSPLGSTRLSLEIKKSFVRIDNGRNRYLPWADPIHIVCDETAL